MSSEKLQAVVFENLDVMHDRHRDVCERLMKKVQALDKMRGIQIIITSNTWQRFLWKFVDKYTPIIIGNCVEAAVYGGNISLELCDADDKLNRLCGKPNSY